MKQACIIFALVSCILCQDLAFPEPGDSRAPPDANKRVPLFVPGKCPANQLLYPGDQETDWICDCSPGYIYYPPKDGCFAAYRQGPCEEGNILVLKQSDVSPTCISNPCKVDGKVRYHSRCYELDKSGPPCKPVTQGGGIFGVNATTLELECLMGSDPYSLFKVPTRCPPGSRRDSTNMCREIF